MTPEQFIDKWSRTQTKEKSAAQEHFVDLCRLLGEPTPNEADPQGDWYCFERGANKTGAGQGWADVWKKGCFGWEYKGKGKDLVAALKQLQLYALALQSPPLLIVSDIERILIHTAFTNAVQETHVIPLEALRDPQQRVTRRPRDGWIIDFGTTMNEADAALFETPFQYVMQYVKPERDHNNREAYRKCWWRHGEPRIAMRAALTGLTRYIATPHVAKHRIFVWMDKTTLPDKMLIVIARADDTTFGILHSRFHELWSLALCTWLGKGNDPRYTPTTTFETFPFPAGLTPADTRAVAVGWGEGTPEPQHDTAPSAGVPLRSTPAYPTYTLPVLADPARLPLARSIAQAAFELKRLRDNWLNPPEWVDWVITPEEEQAGFPRRPVAKPGHEAELKKRTLTHLYNARPAWLAMAHQTLDRAVAAAYGWDDYTDGLPDEEILRRLLALNLARSGRASAGVAS